MAAAQANRDVCYFTCKNRQLRDELYNMHKYLTDKGLSVCKWSGIVIVFVLHLWQQQGYWY